MSTSIRVLVTAVGGDLGQAVVKALRLSSQKIECHGSDLNARGIGSLFADQFHPLPKADDPAYVESLDRLCRSSAIQAVIPANLYEINVLSHLGEQPSLPSGIPIVVQKGEWIDRYGDKLLCMTALSEQVEVVPFADGNDAIALEQLIRKASFPLVVKERRSSGSRGFQIIHDRNELQVAIRTAKQPFVQAFIDDSDGEFSIGVFSNGDDHRFIIFRRHLGFGGTSRYAETAEDQEIKDYVLKIAQIVKAKGSFNIQVRKSKAGVKLLEINPRFSSLTAARAICGFNDAEWSLQLALGLGIIEKAGPFRQIRFSRFLDEVVDFGQGFEPVDVWNIKKAEKEL